MLILRFFLVQALLIGTLVWWLRRDIARLSPARRARCWNNASLWVAIVMFSVLAVPVHYGKSRGWLLGLPMGACFGLAILFGVSALDGLLGMMLDVGG